MIKRKRKYLYIIFSLVVLASCSVKSEYQTHHGKVFGTYYTITYEHPEGENLLDQIEAKFAEFDNSLSTYNPSSIISRINSNDTTAVPDLYFQTMFHAAQKIATETDGAFDITVAPLVNAWGFGFTERDRTADPDVDAILPYVGYDKVSIREGRVVKLDKRIQLDASAIAKGQSCDVIAELLESEGCVNYMVEIGGEVFTKGVNDRNEKWKIAINMPEENVGVKSSDFYEIVELSGSGLATSGNYRQYYYRDGKKYAHTIDPRTGFPVSHNLLSATVIAPNCMEADAYATAFMVMGVGESISLCEKLEDVVCFLIYEDDHGEIQSIQSQNFDNYLVSR